MADLFDEVGEDLRRERLNKLWQRYGVFILGAAALVVVGVAGWRGYETWAESRAAAAGDAFRSALSSAASGDHKLAADALVAFSSGAPADYALLARFRAATERAAAGETDTALSILDGISADAATPVTLKDVARVRAALIAVDKETLDQVRARVAPLDTPENGFRHAARELVAVSAMKAEAWSDARAAIATLLGDPDVPADYRQRANLMEEVIRSAVGPAPAQAGAGS